MIDSIQDLSQLTAVFAATSARSVSLRASVFVAPVVVQSDELMKTGTLAALPDAVEKLNQHFSEKHTHLKFSIDDVLDKVVVSVVDLQDGTVLQQIPSEVALRIAQYLAENNSGLIEAQA